MTLSTPKNKVVPVGRGLPNVTCTYFPNILLSQMLDANALFGK